MEINGIKWKPIETNLVHFGWVKDSLDETFKVLEASLLFDQWCSGRLCHRHR
jgi:hypothetical protein